MQARYGSQLILAVFLMITKKHDKTKLWERTEPKTRKTERKWTKTL